MFTASTRLEDRSIIVRPCIVVHASPQTQIAFSKSEMSGRKVSDAVFLLSFIRGIAVHLYRK